MESGRRETRHGIGVITDFTHEIQKLDEIYFAEEIEPHPRTIPVYDDANRLTSDPGQPPKEANPCS